MWDGRDRPEAAQSQARHSQAGALHHGLAWARTLEVQVVAESAVPHPEVACDLLFDVAVELLIGRKTVPSPEVRQEAHACPRASLRASGTRAALAVRTQSLGRLPLAEKKVGPSPTRKPEGKT